ncbi:MAG: nitrilase-related carbon-nitrogen hydrolase, partial [Trebonia sp.]
MNLTTRVAAWQCQPGPRDVAGNLRRLDDVCAHAAARQVEILVTPEMFTSGYAITADEVLRLAEDAGGPTGAAISEIARRHGIAIVYGHPERARGGPANGNGAYNSATMVGPDGVVRGRHRKVHLYGDLDRDQFVPGATRPAAFDFDG